MKIWTVQAPAVWESLKSSPTGELHSNISLSNYHDAREAYDWMRDQMSGRIQGYDGGYPWWGLTDKSGLPKSVTWPQYQENPRAYLVLELDMPDDQVLLSCLSMWVVGPFHDGIVAWDEDDHLNLARHLRALRCVDQEAYIIQKRETWDRMFDYENSLFDPLWYGPVQKLQATFGPLSMNHVVRVFRPDNDKQIYHAEDKL